MGQVKIAEIIIRVIVLVLQVLAVVGCSIVIGLYSWTGGIGGWMIGIAAMVLFYEVIMIALAFVDAEKVNHQVRLLVDIILNSVAAVLSIVATTVVVVLAIVVFLFLVTISSLSESPDDQLDLTPGAIVALPIGYGVLSTIVFIVAAVSSGVIRSKLANNEDSSISELTTLQPVPVVVTQVPPTFALAPPQPALAGDNNHPPSYSQSYFATKPPSSEAQGCLPSATDDSHSAQKSDHEQKSGVITEAIAALPQK